jgi:neutral ceramidase
MNGHASRTPAWNVGVARRVINPPAGVELAGLGYYLERKWQRVRDNLNATAMVVTDSRGNSVAFAALDLMYNDAAFTTRIRRQASAQTDIPMEAICVNCSHTHNAPTAGFIRGAGERDEAYLSFVERETAAAIGQARRACQPARLYMGHSQLNGMTFNRARENGTVDARVSVLRADTIEGKPLAVLVNFHSHCIAHMETDLHAVSRDWPGEVVDEIERTLPGATALYLQGTCGDVNFRREYNGTEKRFEPARALSRVVLASLPNLRPVTGSNIEVTSNDVALPTRRWTEQEIARDREEGLHRLKTGDTAGWLDGMARSCVNLPERLPLRYGGSVEKAVAAIARFAVEWTDEMLPRLATTPETLRVPVMAARIGDVYFAAHPAEMFTEFGLELRRRWPHPDLFVLGYSNGSVGYLPDAPEIARGGYAALQSPKFTGQFPFTPQSGPALVDGLLAALHKVSGAAPPR